jgi:agmatine deiminase
LTVDGRPFEIVRFPMPPLMEDTLRAGDGVFDYFLKLSFKRGPRITPDQTVKVLRAASYLNFFVTNGLVLMQEYFRPGLSEELRQQDARARALLGRAFPDRQVIGIHAEAVNLGGGGIHCITQQQPAVRP